MYSQIPKNLNTFNGEVVSMITTLVRQFPFPYASEPTGAGAALSMAKINIKKEPRDVLLFLTQATGSESISFLNPNTGDVVGSVDPVDNDTIGSLAWDTQNIRVANVTTGSGYINTIDPYTGQQIGSIAAPPGRGEGLTFDGNYLYYSTEDTIYALDPVTGAQIKSRPLQGDICNALAYGKGRLFAGNSSTGTITAYDLNNLNPVDTINAPGGGTEKVEGLAFREGANELFIANRSEDVIYVVHVGP